MKKYHLPLTEHFSLLFCQILYNLKNSFLMQDFFNFLSVFIPKHKSGAREAVFRVKKWFRCLISLL